MEKLFGENEEFGFKVLKYFVTSWWKIGKSLGAKLYA